MANIPCLKIKNTQTRTRAVIFTALSTFVSCCIPATNIIAVNPANTIPVTIFIRGRISAQIWIVHFVPTEIVACPLDLATGTREVGLTLPHLIVYPVLANTTTVLLGSAPAFPFAVKLLTSFALGTLTYA